MHRLTVHKAVALRLSLAFLLKIGCCFGFDVRFDFRVVVVGCMRVLLLHQIGARTSLDLFSAVVLCPRLLLNTQRANDISNTELLPLMF